MDSPHATPPAPPRLRPVPIRELQALKGGLEWPLEHHLNGLDSLTPVRGVVRAVHRGDALEVEGEAATIVTLCCDRCLGHYNHSLEAKAQELIWLGSADPQSLDVALTRALDPRLDLDADSLSESLDPRGDFDPAHWIFEQLSLQLPLVNRCGADCPGPAHWGSGPPVGEPAGELPGEAAGGDPRWAALAALRQNAAKGPNHPRPQP
ncbi:DUF177 domain-containing protein [Cyanobium sp. LEGE 06113]|uniref:YceD family protein n=1 Tax=Cyanobium sp. LEGE 06113 TaxID=1297573 RepID=UPI00188236E5|nr:DUF177 domain-containing protein [Cyanobium sp. LEGE 06113]MBE9152684.1 DUF177 domain-containing protein [Cyanobium sp. LEGE 06113]MBE9153111.1 DUF177 domain-containing protein [Cyanobium sp. LEGE 06113]